MDSDRIAPPGGIDFGKVAGRAARLYTIENDHLRARITDYGGILVSLEAPAPGGGHDHVVLGFRTPPITPAIAALSARCSGAMPIASPAAR